MNMETVAISKVGQIAIPAKDIERALGFYKDTLGLQLLFNTETMAFFDCNGVRLLLSLPEVEEFSLNSSILYFTVGEIHASFESMKAKGVSFIDEPHVVAKMGSTETWMSFFNDSEGNTHAIMSEVKV